MLAEVRCDTLLGIGVPLAPLQQAAPHGLLPGDLLEKDLNKPLPPTDLLNATLLCDPAVGSVAELLTQQVPPVPLINSPFPTSVGCSLLL